MQHQRSLISIKCTTYAYACLRTYVSCVNTCLVAVFIRTYTFKPYGILEIILFHIVLLSDMLKSMFLRQRICFCCHFRCAGTVLISRDKRRIGFYQFLSICIFMKFFYCLTVFSLILILMNWYPFAANLGPCKMLGFHTNRRGCSGLLHLSIQKP